MALPEKGSSFCGAYSLPAEGVEVVTPCASIALLFIHCILSLIKLAGQAHNSLLAFQPDARMTMVDGGGGEGTAPDPTVGAWQKELQIPMSAEVSGAVAAMGTSRVTPCSEGEHPVRCPALPCL